MHETQRKPKCLPWGARSSARIAIVLVTTVLLLWVLSVLWVGVLPVIFALVVTALLSPAREWMASKGINSAISAALTLVVTMAVLVAITLYILPDVIEQLEDIGSTALSGLDQVQDALAEPPFNLNTLLILVLTFFFLKDGHKFYRGHVTCSVAARAATSAKC